jgi:hypothetical protein
MGEGIRGSTGILAFWRTDMRLGATLAVLTLISVAVIPPAAAAGAGTADRGLVFEVSLFESRVYSGEAVLVRTTIRNVGKTPARVSFGKDEVEAFSFTLRDASGKAVTCEPVVLPEGGVYTPSGVEVPAAGTATKDVVLNHWCSTMLPAGSYTISGSIEPEAQTPEYHDRAPLPKVTFQLHLEIFTADEAMLKKKLSRLEDVVLGKAHMVEGLAAPVEGLPQQDAVEMLALTDSPLAAGCKPWVMKKMTRANSWGDVVGSLARTADVRNAQALIVISQDSHLPKLLRDRATRGVYKLRRTGRPEIVRATDVFIRNNPVEPPDVSIMD